MPPTPISFCATLQQSLNIFYQKFVKIVSVGGCGEEKGGLRGKGIAAAARVYPPLADFRSPRKIFRAFGKLKTGKEKNIDSIILYPWQNSH